MDSMQLKSMDSVKNVGLYTTLYCIDSLHWTNLFALLDSMQFSSMFTYHLHWDFRFPLLWKCGMWFSGLWHFVDGYQHFGGIYHLHIQNITCNVKMEVICSSEILVTTYGTTWCYHPKDCNSCESYRLQYT